MCVVSSSGAVFVSGEYIVSPSAIFKMAMVDLLLDVYNSSSAVSTNAVIMPASFSYISPGISTR